MRRPYLLVLLTLVVSSSLWSLAPVPISSWYSYGLENQRVSCVIADDTTMILAGSDSGVSVRYGGKWFRAAGVRMPVSAMVRVSSERIVAAMSDGSKSDGLYIGTKIRGEPYYQFALLCWITNPQALAASGTKGDTVYAGTNEALYRCVIPNTSTDPTVQPELIKIPPFAFGVEMPTCKAIEIFSGVLFAGGCDRSPNPGPGHILVNGKDSMMILRQMNVSAMTIVNDLIVTPQAGSITGALAIGTVDSGIFMYRNIKIAESAVRNWTRFDSPKKEPISHMIAIPLVAVPAESISPDIRNDVFLVAVPSGVFSGINGNWTALGAIPARPGFLAMHGNSYDSYLAGTDKGVYRYGHLSTGILETGGKALHSAMTLGKDDHRLVIELVKADRITISIYDLTGRLVGKSTLKNLNAGRNSVAFPFDNSRQCPYIVSVSGTNGMVINQLMTIGK